MNVFNEMKAPFCDKITHLLKTAKEAAELSSASRQAAYNKMTHMLRVRHSKAIVRVMAGGCSHVIKIALR
jgi:hypothetical protein